MGKPRELSLLEGAARQLSSSHRMPDALPPLQPFERPEVKCAECRYLWRGELCGNRPLDKSEPGAVEIGGRWYPRVERGAGCRQGDLRSGGGE